MTVRFDVHTVAVIGTGGTTGMRVSDNPATSAHTVHYVETAPAAQQRVRDAGRELTSAEGAARDADIVVLAVSALALAG